MPNTQRRRVRQCVQPLDSRSVLVDGKCYIDFSRNDYLSLTHDPRLRVPEAQLPTGSGSSAVVSGFRAEQAELEQALADFLGYPKVLVLSNGFMANLALQQTFVRRRQSVILDRLVHASIVDGARLAGAKIYRYAHKDIFMCERALQKANGPAWVITDGLFSMDGDIAPLQELSALCQHYSATLVVDDAHGIGVLGPQGKGSVFAAGLGFEEVPFIVGAFGKAFGGYGAFIASSVDNIEAIISSARTYIYTTALPPYCIGHALRAIKLMPTLESERAHLGHLINKTQTVLHSKSASVIQPWVLGSDDATWQAHHALKEAGIWAPVIRPPTVPENTSRIRFSLNVGHRFQDIEQLESIIESMGVTTCPQPA